ncbi:MAG: ubiquitin-like protein Pup [Brevibacterium yomogidense]|uniref:Prokaryotic ubiquitin-like protein Pup n=1 Tax=Brevibacterium yomogidense TaxID=946573 RepID=A0A1X6XEL5_9MICO|nr:MULTISPECIES: ubiquitin-like protein Pup [Brevibacterium]SLM97067.1 Prokaryotic ubiquitin-like protein Pup [Brevibacterium yomogidense]SMX67148.1 prokaryotic ubiquitin-like protein Pup [Brevibacterium sp. Mu109]
MTSSSEQANRDRNERPDLPEDDGPIAPQAQTQVDATAVDSILDDIDSVLESNAEEFVKNFVQKGGQ